jgi:hypothetical protein
LVLEEALLREADRQLHTKGPHRFCANAIWFGYQGTISFKDGLSRFIGWDRDDESVLASSEAYDVTYEHLYYLLPDCGPECPCNVLGRVLAGT